MKKQRNYHVYIHQQGELKFICTGDWSKHLVSLEREGFVIIPAIYRSK